MQFHIQADIDHLRLHCEGIWSILTMALYLKIHNPKNGVLECMKNLQIFEKINFHGV